jgi:uridine phosphorylase
MTAEFPILEFDPTPTAILEPRPPQLTVIPPNGAVICFFADVLAALLAEGRLQEVGAMGSEIGRHPLYLMQHKGQQMLVFHPGVGAPLAAGLLEEVIALGVKNFIVCGGCGVLDKEIAAGHPVILTAAVRDEGTSYHYMPPGRLALPSPKATAALQKILEQSGLEFRTGISWTTDAIYRETATRRARRLAQGCSVVEMEAAAFFAVAGFRRVEFGQLVYGGDLVVPEGWDGRAWHKRTDDRRLMFELAADALLELLELEERGAVKMEEQGA